MTFRWHLTWLAIVALTLGLGFTPGATQGNVKLTIWSYDPLDAIAKAFEASHPGITIEATKLGPWDLHDKFLAGLAAGGAGLPDVVELTGRRLTLYEKTGKLLDMTGAFAKYEGKFLASTWGFVKYKGKIYALPLNEGPAVVYYRQDLFSEAGVNPSSIVTWDDFIAAGERLSKDTRRMLPVFVPSTQWGVNNFMMYLMSRGVNIYTPDEKFIHNNTKAVETLQWYYDLEAKHHIAMPIKFFEPEFWAAFNADQLVTYPMNLESASDLWSSVKSKAGKWGVMPWPLWSKNGPKTGATWGEDTFTAPATTSHPKEAMAFIEFATTNTDGATAAWKSDASWPAYIPAEEAIKARRPWFSDYFQNDLIRAMESRTPPVFYRFNWVQTELAVGAAIDAVYSGRVPAAEAWKKVEQALSTP